ncbi:peptidoglycan-binding protein [Calothrix sp. FACHB-156]|nr:peptidoglycan-binding protein [Calothrix sp. FACHB-156]
MATNYSNEAIRNILIGFGYLTPDSNVPANSPPWKTNNNPLTDERTVTAVKKFQQDYPPLKADGIAGEKTKKVLYDTIVSLQKNLKRHGFATEAQIPSDKPFYGPETYKAVERFEQKQGLRVNGIADKEARTLLNQTNLPANNVRLIDVCAQFKSNPKKPSYLEALNYLQTQLSSDILKNFTNEWRQTKDVNPVIVKLTDVCTFYEAKPHQDKALNYLQNQISPDVYKRFTELWKK